MMHRTLLLAVLLLTGCAGTYGPFAARPPQRVDDPCLPISEQAYRGRDRLALPYDFPEAMPRSYQPTDSERVR
jgi:hypothetical protein